MVDNKQMNSLLDRWRKKHIEDGKIRFIYDGCADYNRYNNCGKKVVFLLREGYFNESDLEDEKRKTMHWTHYFECDENGWYYRFSDNLLEEKPWYMWCKVNDILLSIYRSLGICIDDGDLALHYCGVINIKKSKEKEGDADNGKPNSVMKWVWRYAESDKDLLNEQIDLLLPDVNVCGGTYDIAEYYKFIGNKKAELCKYNSRGLRNAWLYEKDINGHNHKIIVIDMWHPSASISPSEMGEEIERKSMSTYGQ